MKTLYVLRHAKSSWKDPYCEDHDRPLSPRGLKAAPLMGQVMIAFDNPPTLAITSTAKRAHQTAEMLVQITNTHSLNPIEVVTDQRIYAAPVKQLLHLLRELPAHHEATLLIGHNPQLEELVSFLCFNTTEGGIRMSTGALACLTFEINQWSKLQSGTGVLTALIVPRLAKRIIRQKKK